MNFVSSGDYEIDCKTPVYGRSGIVRSTFYTRNGIFNIPTATDQLGWNTNECFSHFIELEQTVFTLTLLLGVITQVNLLF